MQRDTDESLALVVGLPADAVRPRRAGAAARGDATKFGNDPHNQEIGLSLIEDYRRSTAVDRDRLLLAATKHTTGHRKYGDPLEAYHRYAEAFGVPANGSANGDAPVEALALED